MLERLNVFLGGCGGKGAQDGDCHIIIIIIFIYLFAHKTLHTYCHVQREQDNKAQITFHFWHRFFVLNGVKHAELSNNSFEW